VKVLAFLQNQWFKDPEGVKAMLDRQRPVSQFTQEQMREAVRRRFIAYALFAGCLTGRRLKSALGEKWCKAIVWEEANRVIAGDAKTFYPPEVEHVLARVKTEAPDIVILFGKSNHALVPDIAGVFAGLVLTAPHPAARGGDVLDGLAAVRRKLEHLTRNEVAA
jgi:hypothetical protein